MVKYKKEISLKGRYVMMKYFVEFNIFEKILSKMLKRYTIKIYRQGFQDGFNLKK